MGCRPCCDIYPLPVFPMDPFKTYRIFYSKTPLDTLKPSERARFLQALGGQEGQCGEYSGVGDINSIASKVSFSAPHKSTVLLFVFVSFLKGPSHKLFGV